MRDLGTEGAQYDDVGLKKAIEKGVVAGPRMIVTTRAIVAKGSYAPRPENPDVQLPQGAEEAAGALGVDLIFDGPTDPDPAKQNEIVENWITSGVDVIAAACENREGKAWDDSQTAAVTVAATSAERRDRRHAAKAVGNR